MVQSIMVERPRSSVCLCVSSAFLISAVLFMASALLVTDYKERIFGWQVIDIIKTSKINHLCENRCRPNGSEALPRGIVARTSDFQMQQLSGPSNTKKSKSPMNLLAIAVGIKQNENVNKIVQKVVCKRFLHPDVIAEYAYIFLWDEDIGVENFHVGRYLAIVKEEGLQISQPAIDADKSEVHHKITKRETHSKVHRRTINLKRAGRRCYENSTGPPCTGWVEMMAPVFSRASWRCAWYMIQNDLIHAWGLDFQLGYCAQGDRTANIGIVDSEYIVHYGLPTLGGSAVNKVHSTHTPSDERNAVRKRSYVELELFKNRWKKAVIEDKCWTDPFEKPRKRR